jgi:O-antigen/teichoic acid export membrane protein
MISIRPRWMTDTQAGRVKRSFGQVTILLIGAMGGSGSIFLINVLAARSLSVAEFGVYSSVYAIVTVMSLAASFGIPQFWLKSFGEEGWAASRWVKPSLKAQGLVATLAVAAMLAWTEWGPHDHQTRMMLRTMAVYLFGQISLEMVSVKLQLSAQYRTLAIWQVAPNLFRLAIFLLLLTVNAIPLTLGIFALVYSFVSLLMVAAGTVELSRLLRRGFDLVGHGAKSTAPAGAQVSVTRVLRSSWPFGLASVVAVVYFQFDIVMVKYLAGDEAAGYYGVAISIMTAAIVLPGVLYQKYLLPKYHRWAFHDLLLLRQFNRVGAFLSFFCGCLVALAIIVTSLLLIPFFFGSAYDRAITIVNYLALILPLYFLSYNSGSILVATGGIQPKLWTMVGVATLNIALNLVLVPIMGLEGAVVSKAAAYSALCASYLYLVGRHLCPHAEGAK